MSFQCSASLSQQPYWRFGEGERDDEHRGEGHARQDGHVDAPEGLDRAQERDGGTAEGGHEGEGGGGGAAEIGVDQFEEEYLQ